MAKTKVALIFFVTLYVQFAQTHLALPEGAKCKAGGYPGTCKHWTKCFTLIVDHHTNLYPRVCSFKGMDPIVCCTSCDTVDDISKAVLDPLGYIIWKTNQTSWNQCIDYYMTAPYACKRNFIHRNTSISKEWNDDDECFETDIYSVDTNQFAKGDTDAGRYQFPHMALLGYGPSIDSLDWLCDGTIISDRFILTAGHCIIGHLGPVKYAALGILKRTDPEELWHIYEISRIIPYPLFHLHSKYHDIALLETARRIDFNELVLPACLPHLGRNASDDEAEAISWGASGYRKKKTNTLQVVKLKKFNETRCSELCGVERHLTQGYDHSSQMCYGDDMQVKDTYAGGPLHIPGQASTCQKTVIGVTSFGNACGNAASARIYTRVSPYVPWIERIVWP